jgi:RNA polymerase sigma-70 factor (ECF subfamily)
VPAVNSALSRARTALQRSDAFLRGSAAEPATEGVIVDRFVRAYESADLPALVALFTDDVFLSMPPMPLEYRGRPLVTRFFELLLLPTRRYSLVPTRANGGPAFGAYVTGPDGIRHATGLFAVTVTAAGIRAMTRFEIDDFGRFGLPLTLPAR